MIKRLKFFEYNISILLSDNDKCTGVDRICDANAVCNNTVGRFTCSCNPGYTGNGMTCTGIKVS